MVIPQRDMVAATLREGIERGQIRAGIDIERVLDLLGALFAAAFAGGRPGPNWPEATVDALWPALASDP
jgi:hypothetical protein